MTPTKSRGEGTTIYQFVSVNFILRSRSSLSTTLRAEMLMITLETPTEPTQT